MYLSIYGLSLLVEFKVQSSLIHEICSFPISRMVKLYKKMNDAVDKLDYFTQNDWNVRTPANDEHNLQMHDLE